MPTLGAKEIFADGDYNAPGAHAAWPDDARRKGDWRDDWARWVDHGLDNAGLAACLPFSLMGRCEVFDSPDGLDRRRSREQGRFIIGGNLPHPALYIGIDLGRKKGMAGTVLLRGDSYDDVHAEDRDSGNGGWIAVQFTRNGLPTICLGFYFHRSYEKSRAIQQAQVFLDALT